jgi:hypothetical protein
MNGGGLHLVLHVFGQKYLTFFPVTGSFRLHRLVGFARTHVAQFFACLLLKRKVLLSPHSPRSSDGEVIGIVDGEADCDTMGNLGLHLVLQIVGQKYLTIFPVTGSFRLHLLIGFTETHVAQSLSCSLLNWNMLLSSHSPLLLSVGEVVGDTKGKTDGDAIDNLDLHLVLQIVGQKYLTIFPVTGSFRLHLLIGFTETHVAQSLSCSLLKWNVLLSSHFPLLLLVGEANTVGDSVGILIFIVNVISDRIDKDDRESDGLPVGYFVGIRVGKYVGEIMGDRVLLSLLFFSPLPFPLLFPTPFPFPSLFSLLLLFEPFSKLFCS